MKANNILTLWTEGTVAWIKVLLLLLSWSCTGFACYFQRNRRYELPNCYGWNMPNASDGLPGFLLANGRTTNNVTIAPSHDATFGTGEGNFRSFQT